MSIYIYVYIFMSIYKYISIYTYYTYLNIYIYIYNIYTYVTLTFKFQIPISAIRRRERAKSKKIFAKFVCHLKYSFLHIKKIFFVIKQNLNLCTIYVTSKVRNRPMCTLDVQCAKFALWTL
jgi:hypothetical protein